MYQNRLKEAKTLFLSLREQGYEFRDALYKASESKGVTASDLSKLIRTKSQQVDSLSLQATPKFVPLFLEDYELMNLVESEKEEPSYLYF